MDLGTIGRKFRKIGRDTVVEVQKMNDIRQINSKINEQKKQIAALYSQIGEKLYKIYKEAPLEGFDMEFQRIDERFETIEVYRDQIREIKGVRLCPNCHTEVSLSERYCSACGQKLPEILHIQTDENGNTVIEGVDAEIFDVQDPEMPESETEPAESEAESAEVKDETMETEAPEEFEAEPAESEAESAEVKDEAAETEVPEEFEAEPEAEPAEAGASAESEPEAKDEAAENRSFGWN